MKYICIVLCLLFFVNLPAQNVSTQIEKVQDSLRKMKVDTFLVYNIECVGSVYFDSCNGFNKYLFWRQSGKSFIEKVNVCLHYHAEQIDVDDPLMFFFNNRVRIVKEEIKTPVYTVQGRNGKSDKFSVFIDHTCFDELTITTGTVTIKKSVSEFNLNLKKFDNGKMNINYKYNQGTVLKTLVDKADSCIKKFYPLTD